MLEITGCEMGGRFREAIKAKRYEWAGSLLSAEIATHTGDKTFLFASASRSCAKTG
jgi:hypothetical protein